MGWRTGHPRREDPLVLQRRRHRRPADGRPVRPPGPARPAGQDPQRRSGLERRPGNLRPRPPAGCASSSPTAVPACPRSRQRRLAAEHEHVHPRAREQLRQPPDHARGRPHRGPAKIAWGTDAPLLDPRFVLGSYMDAGVGPEQTPGGLPRHARAHLRRGLEGPDAHPGQIARPTDPDPSLEGTRIA